MTVTVFACGVVWQVGQIWDELLSKDDSEGRHLKQWAQLYHSNRSYNVFRLDKIVSWIVQKAHAKAAQNPNTEAGANHLRNTIKALVMSANIEWVDVWKQVKQRQFDPEYKYFGLHFIHWSVS